MRWQLSCARGTQRTVERIGWGQGSFKQSGERVKRPYKFFPIAVCAISPAFEPFASEFQKGHSEFMAGAEGLFMNEKFYGKMMEAAAKAGPFLSTKSCQLLCFGLL